MNHQKLLAEIMDYGNKRAINLSYVFESKTAAEKILAEKACNDQLEKIKKILAGEDPDTIISQLKERFAGRFYKEFDHIIVSKQQSLDEWEAAGKPHTWILMEAVDGYELYIDCAHGHMAIFEHGKLLGDGKDHISVPGVVVMDKDYYGTEKYIWR